MKNIVIYLIGAVSFLSGCESWLDVKPHDKIAEKDLFSTPQGFRNAINGVYVDLNKPALYGKSLTVSLIDVLARCYDVSGEHSMKHYGQYKYDEDGPKGVFQTTWNTMYKLIGDVNLLLANLDEENGILSAEEHDLLKGEALGLRAMMHFDLLRLFGPVYLTDSTAVALPYCEVYNGVVSSMLPANVFKEQVIRDLNQAEILLAKDPVVKNGPMASPDENGRVVNRYRSLRLNYFAVLALQARVALYVNLPERALAYAERGIRESEVWFPFAKGTSWVFEAMNPDRMLSSECLFSLQNTKRNELYRSFFESTLEAKTLLTPVDAYFSLLYEASDWRLRTWWERNEEEIAGTGEMKVVNSLLKYKDVNDKTLLINTLIPMFRRSEMYYIAAEVYAMQESTLPQARERLNAVRAARGIAEPLSETLSSLEIRNVIRDEYRREFCGEGQLFFYYKRTNTSAIIGSATNMSALQYVLPLPDSELQFRD